MEAPDFEERDVGRIVAFTDGVMAVAITLLVLNIEVPRLPGTDERRLEDELADLLPSLLAYLLSFALVGQYWVVHHSLFENLRSFDRALMGLNLTFLALIALVPFASELIDRYEQEPVAAAVFAGILGLAALTNVLMVRYIARRRFLRAPRPGPPEPFPGAVSLAIALVFLLSIPVAYLSVTAAKLLWLLVLVFRYPLRRIGT